jgi:hypothetical protein
MAQVSPANELTLSQVEDQFNLRQVLDDVRYLSMRFQLNSPCFDRKMSYILS